MVFSGLEKHIFTGIIGPFFESGFIKLGCWRASEYKYFYVP